MSYRKLYKWGGACLGIALLLFAAVFLMRPQDNWGSFPEDATGPQPAVLIEVERDFGWRTGDAVPVTIYIKQFPGTSVDVDGLALEGDFEIRGEYKVDSRDTKDGAKIVRVRMTVQSFNVKPVVSARVSMTWNVAGEKDWKEIDPVAVDLHTSNTWDGRKALQEGHPAFIQGLHLLKTIGWLLFGIAGIGVATWYIRRETARLPKVVEPPRKLSLYEWAVLRFDRAWKRIEEGDRSDDVMREIDYVVRKLLHVETVQISHLEMALSSHPFRKQGVYIIKTCERQIFRGDKLTERHVQGLKTAFDQIVGAKVITTEDGELDTK
jgi:hypothetical protein